MRAGLTALFQLDEQHLDDLLAEVDASPEELKKVLIAIESLNPYTSHLLPYGPQLLADTTEAVVAAANQTVAVLQRSDAEMVIRDPVTAVLELIAVSGSPTSPFTGWLYGPFGPPIAEDSGTLDKTGTVTAHTKLLGLDDEDEDVEAALLGVDEAAGRTGQRYVARAKFRQLAALRVLAETDPDDDYIRACAYRMLSNERLTEAFVATETGARLGYTTFEEQGFHAVWAGARLRVLARAWAAYAPTRGTPNAAFWSAAATVAGWENIRAEHGAVGVFYFLTGYHPDPAITEPALAEPG